MYLPSVQETIWTRLQPPATSQHLLLDAETARVLDCRGSLFIEHHVSGE